MPTYDIRLNHTLTQGTVPAPTVPFGALPFPRFGGLPGRLVDANGVPIPWAIRVCTESGMVERYERVDNRFVLAPGTLRLLVAMVLYPAPLAYLPPEEDEADPCPILVVAAPTSSGR